MNRTTLRTTLRATRSTCAAALLALSVRSAALAGVALQVFSVPASSGPAKVDPMAEVSSAVKSASGSAPAVTVVKEVDQARVDPERAALYCISDRPIESLKQQGLTPLLLAERGGHTGVRMVLLAREGSVADQLRGKRLAARALAPEVQPVLESSLFVPAGLSIQALKVVEVSKGIDALLALKSGQVEAALIDRIELEQATKLVPMAVKGLAELKTSLELPYAALLVPDRWAGDPTIAQVAAQLAQRKGDAKGGIDRWVQVKKEP